MKSAKQREKKEKLSVSEGIFKKNTADKKCQKSSGSQRKSNKAGTLRQRKNNNLDVPAKCDLSPEQGGCNSKPTTVNKMLPGINQDNKKFKHPSKIKLQLFPLDDTIRTILEKDGHNPFLELTLSSRKKISSVLTHLSNKWGSSSISLGELTLFPFNDLVEDLTSHKSWNSTDIGITAGDVHSAVGNPETFRLRYGWVSSRHNSPTSPLVCSPKEHVRHYFLDASSKKAENKNQTEIKSKELVVHMDQAVVNDEAVQASQTNKIENGTEVEKASLAEPVRPEDPSLLLSDLSNISMGGLFSEASRQARFNTPGMISENSRSTFQLNTSTGESLNASINQFKTFNSSTTIDAPLSIFNAEDTCHPFGFSKPSTVKDLLSLGRSAFSGLSSQDTRSNPSRCSKPEANVQNTANGCNAFQKPTADPLPWSAGVYKNENSLGLSGIRWNDSSEPFAFH